MFKACLPVPPTANNLFPTGRSGKRFKSKAYTVWEHEALASYRLQHLRPEMMLGRLVAEYRYSFPDKRRRDIANFEKAITDFLKQMGVFEDDSQIDDIRLIRLPQGPSGVLIRIEELP